MKGIVFTEFLTMVENEFGYETADDIVTSSDLESKGVYTAVGTYQSSELFQMIGKLSERTGLSSPDLQEAFGNFLFPRFVSIYGKFFEHINDSFDLLEQLEGYIHVHVLKLYPDAELPSFECRRISENELEMTYQSARRMSSFALGLISAASAHYDQPLEIETEDRSGDGTEVVFRIRKISK